MERTLSQEERIKRAEEIYYRRKQENANSYSRRYINYGADTNRIKSIKSRIIKKILKQIAICLAIYLCLYLLVNSNYFFPEEIHNEIDKYMNYDINFFELYSKVNNYLNGESNIFKKIFLNKEENIENSENANIEDNSEEVEEQDENVEILGENSESIDENAIGGAEVEEVVEESKTQEELDAEYIKNNYGIIWPVNGVITSRYGTRTPTDIITANHYGLDIGANTGTDIVAAMDGTITLTSSYGDYGNHLQIENGNVATLYAHCSKLIVSEGQSVYKGQKIAEVGQTR